MAARTAYKARLLCYCSSYAREAELGQLYLPCELGQLCYEIEIQIRLYKEFDSKYVWQNMKMDMTPDVVAVFSSL